MLVAEMWMDADGALKKHRFHRAMMHSAARLTYNRLQKAKDGAPDDELAPLMDSSLATGAKVSSKSKPATWA